MLHMEFGLFWWGRLQGKDVHSSPIAPIAQVAHTKRPALVLWTGYNKEVQIIVLATIQRLAA